MSFQEAMIRYVDDTLDSESNRDGQAYAYFSLIRREEQKIKLFQGTGKGDEK